jgi:hypothetical protein
MSRSRGDFEVTRGERVGRYAVRSRQREGIGQQFQRVAQVYDGDILPDIDLFLKILQLYARGNQFLESQLVAADAIREMTRIATPSNAPKNRPIQSSRLGSRLSTSPKNLPTKSHAPSQNVAPIPSKNRNSPELMPLSPATGGASVAKPGTNLAIISVTERWRPSESCVRRTHGAGSSDNLHKKRSARWWP